MVRGQARASRDDVMVRPSQRAAAGALEESSILVQVAQKFCGKDPHSNSVVVRNETEVYNLNEQYRRRL